MFSSVCLCHAVGTRLLLKNTSHGTKIAQAVPLIMGDSMEKADIEICKNPNGTGDWLLGKGASGRVVAYTLVSHASNLDVPISLHWPVHPVASDVKQTTRQSYIPLVTFTLCLPLHMPMHLSVFQ